VAYTGDIEAIHQVNARYRRGIKRRLTNSTMQRKMRYDDGDVSAAIDQRRSADVEEAA